MFHVGFFVLVNIAIYEAFGIRSSTNWEIYYLCNYNLLLVFYFYEFCKNTKIEIYKNFCKLVMWYFIYDILAQLTYINKTFENYQQTHSDAKETLLILISGFIALAVFKIRNKNN